MLTGASPPWPRAKGHVLVDHVLHEQQVLLGFADLGPRIGVRIGQHGELQPHAGQRGPEVVRDPGQHLRTLRDLTLDAPLHLQEGGARETNLGRACGLEVGHGPTLAQRVGRRRQPPDGANLVAQKHDGDRRHQDRHPCHPQEGQDGGRFPQAPGCRQQGQHAVRPLDPNCHPLVGQSAVEMVGGPDALVELPVQHFVRDGHRSASEPRRAAPRPSSKTTPNCISRRAISSIRARSAGSVTPSDMRMMERTSPLTSSASWLLTVSQCRLEEDVDHRSPEPGSAG